MNKWIKKSLCQSIVVAGLFASTSAGAVNITGSGVDTLTKRFVIDGTVSTVTHNPGTGFVFGDNSPPPPQPQSYVIAGQFDANFSRYWWSYYLDGDTDGTQGSFIFEQNWLTFNNANIIGNISPSGFRFPSYFVFVNGSELFGGAACNTPRDPNTYCSGFEMGPAASLTGLFKNGRISLQGAMPLEPGNIYSESFSYNIQASTIPEPSFFMLLVTGLGFLLVIRVIKPVGWVRRNPLNIT